MHMILVLAFSGLVASGDDASTTASEPSTETTVRGEVVSAPRKVADWSVGGGVGVVVYSGGGLNFSSGPTARASIEKRIAEQTWLMLGVSAVYSESSQPALLDRPAWQSSGGGGNLSVGARHAFDLGGVVTVSPYIALEAGVRASRSRSVQSASTIHNNSYELGAEAGLIVERELVDGLAVRFSSSVLQASYSKSTTRGVGSNSFLSMGLGFAPALEARMYW